MESIIPEIIRSNAVRGLAIGAMAAGTFTGLYAPQFALSSVGPKIAAAEACQAYEQDHSEAVGQQVPVSTIPRVVIINCGLEPYISTPSVDPDLGAQVNYDTTRISLPDPTELQGYINDLKNSAKLHAGEVALGAMVGGLVGAIIGSGFESIQGRAARLLTASMLRKKRRQ